VASRKLHNKSATPLELPGMYWGGDPCPQPGRERWGHTYLRPKDSNAAFRVRDHATQKVPEKCDIQTFCTLL